MITVFENYNRKYNGVKWKIPLHEPEFFICLRKAGMNDKQFEEWLRLKQSNVFGNKEYICLEKSDPYGKYFNSYFTWSPNIDNRHDYLYLGEMEITSEDYEEFEMQKNAKKYNL